MAEHAGLKRIEYPVEDTVRTVLESPLPEPAKGLLTEVFRTGSLAKPDSGKQKMMAAATYKLFDKQVRAYGNVGIITGRAQASMNGTYIVEFLYTAVFVKQNEKWMFTLWQGTISKDSPPPPPFPKTGN